MRLDYCVVIPAHNAEQFVASTLASVQRQTVLPREIVVVDDGSSDRTAEIAAACGVTVITVLQSGGPSASRNIGVASTSTPVVTFLDADDEWQPDHAERLVAALCENNAVFASSAAEKFGSETGILRANLGSDAPIDLRDALIVDNPVVQSGAAIRRVTFEQVGGYDESMRMSEDYDLWARIADHGSYAYVDQPTVRRRMHDGQLTHRLAQQLFSASWGVRRRSVTRRLLGADAAERERLFGLLEVAATRDVEGAVWMGAAAALGMVRDELRRTDALFGLKLRLSTIAGHGLVGRRVSQDVRCMGRSLVHAIRGQQRFA